MGTPGSGRYTNFTFTSSDTAVKTRYTRLATLFNNRSAGMSQLYGIDYEKVTNNGEAAANVAQAFRKFISQGVGDPQMFPKGVSMIFADSPDIDFNIKFEKIGDPSNAYVPNLASPGPDQKVNPVVPVAVKTTDLKPDLNVQSPVQSFNVSVGGNTGVGTANPATTVRSVGLSSVGTNLTLGSYIKG